MEKILVIDDEVNIRESVKDFLEYHAFEVTIAGSGEEGLKIADDFKPNLILCDVNMGGMNGYEVIHALKSKPEIADTPFVFITAKATMQDLRTGMNHGADDYLTKPFELSELLRCIRASLEKGATRQRFLKEESRLLDEERKKLEKLNYLNSHELRAGISRIMSLHEAIKINIEITKEQIAGTLDGSLRQIETVLHEIDKLITKDEIPVLSNGTDAPKIETLALVDDDEIACMLNSMMLRSQLPQLEVATFTNPLKFLEQVRANKYQPDLILLDINMPEMDGFQVLDELLKASYAGRVIMLSSSISPDEIARAQKHPLTDSYEMKPLTIEKVKKVLRVKS